MRFRKQENKAPLSYLGAESWAAPSPVPSPPPPTTAGAAESNLPPKHTGQLNVPPNRILNGGKGAATPRATPHSG